MLNFILSTLEKGKTNEMHYFDEKKERVGVRIISSLPKKMQSRSITYFEKMFPNRAYEKEHETLIAMFLDPRTYYHLKYQFKSGNYFAEAKELIKQKLLLSNDVHIRPTRRTVTVQETVAPEILEARRRFGIVEQPMEISRPSSSQMPMTLSQNSDCTLPEIAEIDDNLNTLFTAYDRLTKGTEFPLLYFTVLKHKWCPFEFWRQAVRDNPLLETMSRLAQRYLS